MFRSIRTSDLNTTEFTPDQRAVLIAHKETVESFLEKLMTIMINSRVDTREDIKMCRDMKDYGITMLEIFKEENNRK